MFNNTLFHFRSESIAHLIFGVALFAGLAQPAQAVYVDPTLPIPTQLLNFGLTADMFIPLTSAATTSTLSGAPTPIDGYGWVKTNVALSLSTNTPSTGQAYLGVPYSYPDLTDSGVGGAATGIQGCVEGGGGYGMAGNGDTVCVSSFFDVFFNVALTDIDSTAGFFGGVGPATLAILDLGPANMQQNSECIADTSQNNLGCLPPEGSAYIGHFEVKMPLGADINGNSLNDILYFTLVQHKVEGVTNTYVQGGNVFDTFNSSAGGSGYVGDDRADPPFGPFTLTGPTTAQQGIVYAAAPEPATPVLFGAGLGLLVWNRRRMAS